MYEIDKTDVKIINLLMEDGRMPASEMARRIGGISERVVRYRIERIVKEGYIQISAITNPKSLGYSVTADVFLEVESGAILEVAKKASEFDCVSYVACSIGERDISIQIVERRAITGSSSRSSGRPFDSQSTEQSGSRCSLSWRGSRRRNSGDEQFAGL